jgi:MraZ protein
VTGIYEHTIDAKGRLSIPAKIKEELGDPFYVTLSMDKCLKAYSLAGWGKLMEKYEAMTTAQKNKIRPLFAHAARCDLDSQGRVLIPQKLREFAGLVKDVAIVGTGDTAEFWDAAEWAAKDAIETTPENIAAVFMELGI